MQEVGAHHSAGGSRNASLSSFTRLSLGKKSMRSKVAEARPFGSALLASRGVPEGDLILLAPH